MARACWEAPGGGPQLRFSLCPQYCLFFILLNETPGGEPGKTSTEPLNNPANPKNEVCLFFFHVVHFQMPLTRHWCGTSLPPGADMGVTVTCVVCLILKKSKQYKPVQGKIPGVENATGRQGRGECQQSRTFFTSQYVRRNSSCHCQVNTCLWRWRYVPTLTAAENGEPVTRVGRGRHTAAACKINLPLTE